MATAHHDDHAGFVALSVDLTGHSANRLRGTGLVPVYAALLMERAGAETAAALLAAHATLQGASGDSAALERAIRLTILSDPRLGPPARSLLKLWYVGVWQALPLDWHATWGGAQDDADTVPQPTSYTEGLLWPTVGGNPAGAKPFGYGIWANPPIIPNPQEEV
jgi:hypothetical protein